MADRAAGRLLIATELGAHSASSRYRALQFAPGLRDHFDSVCVSLPDDEPRRAPGRVGQIRYFASHARRYGRRWHGLTRHVPESDAILVQRGLYPLGPAAITRPLQHFSGRVVLDLDDAVLSLRPSLAGRGALTRWLYDAQQARALLRRADAVVVSSTELASSLDGLHRAVTVLPTVPDPRRYPLATGDDRRPAVVGWAGNLGNLRYLDPLREVFARLREEQVATLEVVSAQPWDGPSDFHQWTLAAEASVFTRFSIGIMPLPDTPYTRAKAAFKLLQYWAAGLPVVASPVGVNRVLLASSGAGLAATTPAEWESALRRLAIDAPLRRELGARGRQFIERYADIDGHVTTLAALLRGDDDG